jgi:acyl-CoA thioester hydrolase
MFTKMIEPRAGEIDFLGHINNSVLSAWFELGRNPFYESLAAPRTENRRLIGWPLIMAHSEYDFKKQIYFQPNVEIRTWVERIGHKSFTIYQEAWQNDEAGTPCLCVTGRVVMVYFDFATQKTRPVPEDQRKLLEKYLKRSDNV